MIFLKNKLILISFIVFIKPENSENSYTECLEKNIFKDFKSTKNGFSMYMDVFSGFYEGDIPDRETYDGYMKIKRYLCIHHPWNEQSYKLPIDKNIMKYSCDVTLHIYDIPIKTVDQWCEESINNEPIFKNLPDEKKTEKIKLCLDVFIAYGVYYKHGIDLYTYMTYMNLIEDSKIEYNNDEDDDEEYENDDEEYESEKEDIESGDDDEEYENDNEENENDNEENKNDNEENKNDNEENKNGNEENESEKEDSENKVHDDQKEIKQNENEANENAILNAIKFNFIRYVNEEAPKYLHKIESLEEFCLDYDCENDLNSAGFEDRYRGIINYFQAISKHQSDCDVVKPETAQIYCKFLLEHYKGIPYEDQNKDNAKLKQIISREISEDEFKDIEFGTHGWCKNFFRSTQKNVDDKKIENTSQ